MTVTEARASRGSGEMPADIPVQVRSEVDYIAHQAERGLADASAFSRTRAMRVVDFFSEGATWNGND